MIELIFFILFLCTLLFFATVQPIWALIDCAISKKASAGAKIVVILLMIFLWGLMGLIYGLFLTSSKALKSVTRLGFIIVVGLIVYMAFQFGSVSEMNAAVTRGRDILKQNEYHIMASMDQYQRESGMMTRRRVDQWKYHAPVPEGANP